VGPALLLGNLIYTRRRRCRIQSDSCVPGFRSSICSSNTHQNEKVEQGLHLGPILPTPLHQLVNLLARMRIDPT
jgi:hypothetical protein